jgi:hypothetical protein
MYLLVSLTEDAGDEVANVQAKGWWQLSASIRVKVDGEKNK